MKKSSLFQLQLEALRAPVEDAGFDRCRTVDGLCTMAAAITSASRARERQGGQAHQFWAGAARGTPAESGACMAPNSAVLPKAGGRGVRRSG